MPGRKAGHMVQSGEYPRNFYFAETNTFKYKKLREAFTVPYFGLWPFTDDPFHSLTPADNHINNSSASPS